MALIKYEAQNEAKGTLAASLSAGSGIVVVEAGQGPRFGSVFPMRAKIVERDGTDPSIELQREIVTITGRTGDSLNITRAVESITESDSANAQTQTALAFSSGDEIAVVFTKGVQDDINSEVESLRNDLTTVENEYINKDGSVPFTGNQAMGDNKITGLKTPTAGTDAVTKDYADSLTPEVSSFKKELGNAGEVLWTKDAVRYGDSTLLLPDASQTTGTTFSTGQTEIGYSATIFSAGQSFLAINTGIMNKLTVHLDQSGSPTFNITAKIYSDTAGTLVATSTNTIDSSTVSASGAFYDFTFNAGAITAATTYYIALEPDAVGNTGDNVDWSIEATDIYAGGIAYKITDGNVWSATSGDWDRNFEVELISGEDNTKIYKASADSTGKMDFIGFTDTSEILDDPTDVFFEGIVAGFTGLTKGSPVYLSDTAGAVSHTPWTNSKQIGVAVSTTEIQIGIVEEKEYDSGTFSRLETAATESIVYNHNLGRIPRKIDFEFIFNSQDIDQSMMRGFAINGSSITNRCIGSYDKGSNVGLAVQSACIRTGNSNDDGQTGVVSAITDTTFTIDWTYSSGASNTIDVIWSAF